uniref:WKF domain-containing protein n=1 Tax=Octactis speculum TaxID=3111310 RepID=A0A7S2CZI3_9STRA|mmetsp:Transcript_40902/g.55716  ORF Transcript_40902/g.55716 Transcript_40902/m.55716 type:complete len:182 (+) Transcript_40902:71-616(+)
MAKKRKSKHQKAASDAEAKSSGNSGNNVGQGSKKQRKMHDHTKEPEEAAQYLTLWQEKHTSGWRFNKSTQSWLLRHMYDKCRVEKDTFKMLLEYLAGLQGAARDRAMKHATLIIELEGGLTVAERERARENAAVEAIAEGEEESQEGGGSAIEIKEEGRDKKRRLLRAQKVMLVLSEEEAS